MEDKSYLVYMLRCSDGTLYTGMTNNIERRFKMHSAGRGAKYVRTRLPLKIVYIERGFTKVEALRRERKIKSLCKKAKEKLVLSCIM